MKGFKALNIDMTSRYGDMRYQLKKTYYADGELEICRNGFHFCEKLEDTVRYYPIQGSRFFVVEASGNILKDEYKNVAERITLLYEISVDDAFLKYLMGRKDSFFSKAVAEYGRPGDLDTLVYNKDWEVRQTVVKQGRPKDLNILVHDENWHVRYMVAKYGREKDLDILVHDENENVRRVVAEKGRPKDMDILVHDPSAAVRYMVARNGRWIDLDILMCDESVIVRREVARHYYKKSIRKLINDSDDEVRHNILSLYN